MNIPDNATTESTMHKDGMIASQLVRQYSILMCGDYRCINTTNAVGPHMQGWALVEGWWYCPQHWKEGT